MNRKQNILNKYLNENWSNSSSSDSSDEDNPNTNNNNLSNYHPTFIPSNERNLITDHNKSNEWEALEKAKLKETQIKNYNIILEQTKESNKPKEWDKIDLESLLPDDTDNLDDWIEYSEWKKRELNRIIRYWAENESRAWDKKEIERRRNWTDEQRKEENLKLGSDSTIHIYKSKLNFLQKYYHKGAFFQNESKENSEHIYNRDFNLPTWEDKIDKSALPATMAKRRGKLFKRGQTKYTHLTNEDTTNFDPSFKVPENISKNIQAKSGGFKSINMKK